ncbi:14662_t:CDS:2, partial [Funneliformis geosporum]
YLDANLNRQRDISLSKNKSIQDGIEESQTKSGCEKKHQQMDHQNCKLEVSKHEETLRN